MTEIANCLLHFLHGPGANINIDARLGAFEDTFKIYRKPITVAREEGHWDIVTLLAEAGMEATHLSGPLIVIV